MTWLEPLWSETVKRLEQGERLIDCAGDDDLVLDGDVAYSVLVAAPVSSDPAYAGLGASAVTVLNLDDEAPPALLRATKRVTQAGTATLPVVYEIVVTNIGAGSQPDAANSDELIDVLPAQLHLTLPEAWRRRRFRIPAGIVLHHADVPAGDRTWSGPVPLTTPRRTLSDCARSALSPELLRPAAQQALRRGLVGRDELGDVETALAPFGGLAA